MGLIHTSWGGTPAEAWTDLAHLQSSDVLKPIVDRYQSQQKDAAKTQSEYEMKLKSWATLVKQELDPVNAGEARGYAQADFDDSAWKSLAVPGAVESALQEEFDGSIWVRKAIDVPPEFAGKPLTLNLGAIDDWDDTYFNGEKVGAIGPDHDGAWRTPRSYTVPALLVHAGKNVIAARIFDSGGGGGFMGPRDALKLSIKDQPRRSISLSGDWKYAIETPLKISSDQIPPAPASPNSPGDPATLYNAMIHPIIGYGIKGAIWYQGEANSWRAYQYRTLLPAMIGNWRSAWGQGDFPFFIVQLANFAKDWTDPSESDGWAELREAQFLTARNVANCGLAVAIDVGEPKDIHPRNKQAVGLRLALQARKKVYGQDVVASGPEYKSQEIKGNKIILHFNYVSGGLRCNADKLGAFAIAGEDQKFHWANARIVGETVEVSSDEVSSPVAVRYAWGSNPVGTLYNAEGLPAIPFRTDDWETSTLKNR
jgi:sialate O-acetylesterase